MRARLPFSDAVRAALAVPTPQAEARDIVQKAWNMRNAMLKRGAGHVQARELHTPMVQLQVWLERNPHPSLSTMRQFGSSLGSALATVLPHNEAGQKMLRRFYTLIQSPQQ